MVPAIGRDRLSSDVDCVPILMLGSKLGLPLKRLISLFCSLNAHFDFSNCRVIFGWRQALQHPPGVVVSTHSVREFFSLDAIKLSFIGETFDRGRVVSPVQDIFVTEHLPRADDGYLHHLVRKFLRPSFVWALVTIRKLWLTCTSLCRGMMTVWNFLFAMIMWMTIINRHCICSFHLTQLLAHKALVLTDLADVFLVITSLLFRSSNLEFTLFDEVDHLGSFALMVHNLVALKLLLSKWMLESLNLSFSPMQKERHLLEELYFSLDFLDF